jgi:hypothetical protein
MFIAGTISAPVAPASRRLSGRHPASPAKMLLIAACTSLFLSSATARTQRIPPSDPNYLFALATANRYLQAWQSGDVETGTALLTSHAKEKVTTDILEGIFSTSGPLAYEIGRGKMLRRGRYEFPVVLVGPASIRKQTRRRFSNIVVLNTGNNDWTVDKLP